MPHGVHRKQARTYRPDSPELYERAKEAAAAVGSDMNSHLNAFLRWLTRETDELPPRPPAPGAGESPES
ncbi:hypothetical protein [Streptomyces aidingensis]|uniref:Uncharacterized protein n=1 Tax=Streptomyces aidingensis TaxID=910347 RepID=A0A1I1PRW4_9ACTN|nr:hypothetical protein [Streptomyces aidingensis]SFD12631.1 hypothetical protein SAMN05421773_11019 [Streptomyces aidingensis]